MRLTTKGRYAVTAMLDLALHANEGPVSLADIAKRQNISLSYLEQLFAKLRKNNLVSSVRGPGGGYKLGHETDAIFVAQIVDAVDESIDATHCRGAANCQDGEVCLTHYLWSDLSKKIHEFLNGISLATLLARRDIVAVAERQDRHCAGQEAIHKQETIHKKETESNQKKETESSVFTPEQTDDPNRIRAESMG